MTRSLDAHARPPNTLKEFYKRYQKSSVLDLEDDEDVLDFNKLVGCSRLKLNQNGGFDRRSVTCAGDQEDLVKQFLRNRQEDVQVYTLESMPGLKIIPNLLPQATQTSMLDLLIHRDVSNPEHQSNLHLHYDLTYPDHGQSFFTTSPKSMAEICIPKDSAVHKPFKITQMLNKKLRWITLGGQYDWTNKVYPSSSPPDFPPDEAALLHYLFPKMLPQAAILNFYSPGDTLSLHRDVAESCARGLISLSIGCDAIFILGLEDEVTGEVRMVALRLRSGDAVFMDGRSRFAWHGVPKIVEGTCPEWLKNWPGEDFPEWKGWMEGKRINLNVRQMSE